MWSCEGGGGRRHVLDGSCCFEVEVLSIVKWDLDVVVYKIRRMMLKITQGLKRALDTCNLGSGSARENACCSFPI